MSLHQEFQIIDLILCYFWYCKDWHHRLVWSAHLPSFDSIGTDCLGVRESNLTYFDINCGLEKSQYKSDQPEKHGYKNKKKSM